MAYNGPASNLVKTRSLKSKILDLAQTSIFQVRVRPPEEVLRFLRNTMRGSDLTDDSLDNIYLLCHDAKLPATSLATHDVTDDYQGVTEKLAYRRIYDESIDLTFYVDHNYKVIELFDGWIDYISGLGVTGTRDQYKSVPTPFRFAYPDSYRDNIYLTKFEKDLSRSTSLGYTFIKAYPSSMISIPVTYGASDILRCTVSFTYVRYVRERMRLGGSSSSGVQGTVVGVVNIAAGLYQVERLVDGQIVTTIETSAPAVDTSVPPFDSGVGVIA